ncbi:SpoIIE family protein phosphatase [Streptomyces sp. NPDC006706]|uniref:ATP-binding SpoIIE family protein phosphatase n=1 Tax=Streptomyces sp. NPDC006706 TaxID=3364761 RepID=UPI00367D6737
MSEQAPVDAAAARLLVITTAGESLSGADLLSFALDQAVTESGGLGGMVHLRGPGSCGLLLTAVHGLLRTAVRNWAEIAEASGTAPARAAARGTPVWEPVETIEDRTGAMLPAGGGLLAVPLIAPEGVLGALSVLMAPAEEPTPQQRAAVEALTAWAALRLGQLPAVGQQVQSHHSREGPRPPRAEGARRPRSGPAIGRYGEPVRSAGPEGSSGTALTALHSMSRALWQMSDAFFVVDGAWRVTFVNAEAERLLGVSHALLGRTLWDIFASLRVDLAAPDLETRCRQAVDSGAPATFEMRWPTNRRWYRMRLVPVPDGLTVYAADVTESRARAAERAAAERAAAERIARVTELTTALAQALTMRDVVAAIAAWVLPPFNASGLVIQIIEGRVIRVAGSVGYSRAFLDKIDGTAVTTVSPVSEVHHSGKPAFIGSAEEYVARYPLMSGLPSAAGKAAWAFLPLIVSGRCIGCCVISFAESRLLNREEQTLLTALSGLMAQAIERARLYDTEHTRAKELQRGLLPRALPSLRFVDTAARYLPASEGIDVGGDWYDVIPLSGARVALVVGDVMGHGLPEAATMGRLRTAVHTLADLEFPPAELLNRLNDLVNDLGENFYATCLYAVYDPVSATCTFACAGHPPPAIVRPGQPVKFSDCSPDPPLGAARPPFETSEIDLPEGSLLVLYTDGLVDAATGDIDDGMNDLARVLSSAVLGSGLQPSAGTARRGGGRTGCGNESLARLCDDVLAGVLPDRQLTDDDVALLIARMHAVNPEDVAAWPLSDGPIAAGEAREHVRDQLARWDVDALTMAAELLVSELVGNAVRHAKGPVGLRLLRGERLICEVSDSSLTTPRIRHASETDEGGRGLQLVAALSDRWGARYTSAGKCIWTEQQMP